MTRLRILCSQKSSYGNHLPEITHVGGVSGGGEKWKISVQDAIEGIRTGTFEFYIIENLVEIPVTIHLDNPPSLLATGNGFLHNLLEDLPDCP